MYSYVLGYKNTKHNTKNKLLAFPSLGKHTGGAEDLGAVVAFTEDTAVVSRVIVVVVVV